MDTPNSGQAETASIEDRAAAALFGTPKAKPQPPVQQARQEQPPEPESTGNDEDTTAPTGETTETGDGSEAPQEETFEFEADGEKFILPKKLEKAVQQQKDYTQKTMEIAEQRKQFELLHEQARIANFQREFEADAAQELAQLRAYDSVLQQPIDWSSMSTDEAFRKKLQIDQWKDEREAIAKTLQGKHQQFEKKTQDALKELKAKATDTISKKIPNWSEATHKAIRDHALADGYTEAELNSIIDPRHTLTLWKAQQFDQLKAKATKAVTDVRTVKASSSNPMPQHVKEKLAFNKQIKATAENSSQRKQVVEDRVASLFTKR
jgi:hypothetical protein